MRLLVYTHSHLDLTFTEAEVSPVLFTLAA